MSTKASVVLFILSLPGAPALAHHSNTMFDNAAPLALTGTVREFQWHNPHTYIQLLVTNEQGVAEEWSVEMAAPMYLYNLGWRPSTLKEGDKVSATVWPLRNAVVGSRRGGAASLDAEGHEPAIGGLRTLPAGLFVASAPRRRAAESVRPVGGHYCRCFRNPRGALLLRHCAGGRPSLYSLWGDTTAAAL